MMPLSEAIAIRAQQLQGAAVDPSVAEEAMAVIQKSQRPPKPRKPQKKVKSKYRPEDTATVKRLRVLLWRLAK